MTRHPYRDVAIAAGFDTVQARRLDGADALTLARQAAEGALAAAGLDRTDVDGVVGPLAGELTYSLGLGPAWRSGESLGIRGVLAAAGAVATGHCQVVLLAGAGAGAYVDREATAPWTRPGNEFVASVGMYTAVEFALVARRHMEDFGTRPEHLAAVAATIRNNGHDNPAAVYHGRGPWTADDVLASRLVAEPFHLLDCAMTSEGGSALVVTTAARAADLATAPVYLLGAGIDTMGPEYRYPPSWDLSGADSSLPNGYVGRRAARQAFATAGLSPADVQCCELYDPFSFEVIRQLEAYGFCQPGEGGELAASGALAPGGRWPVATDGGLLSYSHNGATQKLQRVARAVAQLQGTCPSHQVAGAEVALVSNGGAGALYNDVLLLGSHRP